MKKRDLKNLIGKQITHIVSINVNPDNTRSDWLIIFFRYCTKWITGNKESSEQAQRYFRSKVFFERCKHRGIKPSFASKPDAKPGLGILIVFSLLVLMLHTSCGNNTIAREGKVHGETNSYEKKEIDILTKDGVLAIMSKTAQWQMDNLKYTFDLPNGTIEPLTNNSWVRAAFLSGMMALYDVSKEKKYFDYVNALGESVDFKLGERKRHADEHAIGKVYADLYLISRDEKYIADMVHRFDEIKASPSRGPEVGWVNEQNWSWCDALFMGPPAWIKLYTCTGKRAYLNEMNEMFWETYDHLYSQEDSLFYRDASYKINKKGEGRRTANGKKIFWGRGIGWVIGGLGEIMTYMPGDFPDRKRYENLFVEMIEKIASLQANDGLWRTSLYDYQQYPTKEFSASAFFCYGMAWGINHQLLDSEIYKPKVVKAWIGLNDCIHENGKIGYVQKVGADPNSVDENDTMDYGTGAFLLAGKEVYEMMAKETL